MVTTAFVAGLCGAIVGLVVAKLYVVKYQEDGRTEAYEEGWSNGYDIGLQANRPKRTRTRKADV